MLFAVSIIAPFAETLDGSCKDSRAFNLLTMPVVHADAPAGVGEMRRNDSEVDI
jgi:hypothetical protein